MTVVGLAVLLCPLQPLPGQTVSGGEGESTGPPLRYRVSTEETEIVIRVFRAGALARFGHNHVISAKGIEGTITLGTGGAPSSFVLRLPVEALEVDDPDLRREAGADFASEPSAGDVADTRENMLGPRVLDAAEHPFITVSGTTQGPAYAVATVNFEVRQHATEKLVPIDVLVTEQSVRVGGALELSHEELGLRPFRALAGALRVSDRLQISFEIVAIPDR